MGYFTKVYIKIIYLPYIILKKFFTSPLVGKNFPILFIKKEKKEKKKKKKKKNERKKKTN